VEHPVRVAYLGGIGRSGSTLVSRALDRLPGMVAVGELSNLWHQSVLRDTPCGCGRPFSACPFWRDVGLHAFGGWDRVDAAEVSALRRRVERVRYLPALLRPGVSSRFASDVARYRDITMSLYAAILAVAGGDVVVDNSKLPSRVALLRGAPGLDLRVVHLVRSSYGVCYSWSKQLVRADAAEQAMLRYPVGKSAARWTAFNTAFEVLRRLGVPTLRMRYEDFVRDPRAELVRVLDFLERPYAEEDLAFVDGTSVDLAEDHSVWGNPMRMRVGREQLRLDEEWRSRLGPRDRRTIRLLTGPGMRRYGYAVE
jgi:hypothetical protein